jgi:endonuclease/exonuclease/phosphatase family metal-dependent hydrolase
MGISRRVASVVVLALSATTGLSSQVPAPRAPSNVRIVNTASPLPPLPGVGRLRVMTWNIHFGKTAADVLNLEAQARVMADADVDVILLQEAATFSGDQPTIFPQLLQTLTGKTWQSVFAAHSGGTTGEGTLILSRLPLVSSSTANFHNRGFSRIEVSVNGVFINLFSGHLAWSPTTLRTSQLTSWMTWMRSFAGPEIAGGDFNSWWGESWIATMESEYTDTWQDVTGSDEYGYTLNNVRFDYLFRARDGASRLKPVRCVVISTSTSDHRPVVGEWEVR